MATSEKDLLNEQASHTKQLEQEVATLKQRVRVEEEVKKRSEQTDKEKDEVLVPVSPTLLRFSASEDRRTSLLDIPNSIIENEVSPKLSLQDLAQLALTSKGINRLFKQSLINANLLRLLEYVAFGKQDEAEAILKKYPSLALKRGTVTDHAKRTFKDITGFQYAVWALDWQMWRMIKSYLSKEAAEEQARGFAEGFWVKEHGEHADWKKLTEAQQTLIDNWNKWDKQKIARYWIEQIGRAQLLLPIHVLQEYNQCGRPLSPCPQFDSNYKLTRKLDYGFISKEATNRDKPLEADRLGVHLASLGVTVAIYRGQFHPVALNAEQGHDRGWVIMALPKDFEALIALFDTRTQQRETLVAELAKKPSVSPSK